MNETNNTSETSEDKLLCSTTPTYKDTELIFGIVCAVGTDSTHIVKGLTDKLEHFFHYNVIVIDVSEEILKLYLTDDELLKIQKSEFDRVMTYMDKGNFLRRTYDEGILAMAIADMIYKKRFENRVNVHEELKPLSRTAIIIKSLKNKKEIELLRKIYDSGFYLLGVYEDEESRITNLMQSKHLTREDATQLVQRDQDEQAGYGQQTREAYQQSDLFIDNSNEKRAIKILYRFIGLIFCEPYSTPTFGEFAMHMAFSVAMRSSDLSRQIGAVICRDYEVIAMGANDCPKFKGGLYWTQYNDEKGYFDIEGGKDYTRGFDPNKDQFISIAESVLGALEIKAEPRKIDALKSSQLAELTEYGRVVHAEMEALAMCARNSISSKGAEMYVTTFPCHNCAKHIISSGIIKVYYVEAYPKSKALELYKDSITIKNDDSDHVQFLPFFGVGPRRYRELFSVNANPLPNRIRKDTVTYGKKYEWKEDEADARLQLLPTSYIMREMEYAFHYSKFCKPLCQ